MLLLLTKAETSESQSAVSPVAVPAQVIDLESWKQYTSLATGSSTDWTWSFCSSSQLARGLLPPGSSVCLGVTLSSPYCVYVHRKGRGLVNLINFRDFLRSLKCLLPEPKEWRCVLPPYKQPVFRSFPPR